MSSEQIMTEEEFNNQEAIVNPDDYKNIVKEPNP